MFGEAEADGTLHGHEADGALHGHEADGALHGHERQGVAPRRSGGAGKASSFSVDGVPDVDDFVANGAAHLSMPPMPMAPWPCTFAWHHCHAPSHGIMPPTYHATIHVPDVEDFVANGAAQHFDFRPTGPEMFGVVTEMSR